MSQTIFDENDFIKRVPKKDFGTHKRKYGSVSYGFSRFVSGSNKEISKERYNFVESMVL